ncbi:MAG: chemotaxis protein CheD [Myxococcota bacterium]
MVHHHPNHRASSSGVTLLLNLGEVGITSRPADRLKIIGLGSCVAVCMWCPSRRVAAMAHVVFPHAKGDPRGQVQPGYFADTALPLLNDAMARQGCAPEAILVRLVGGAAVLRGLKPSMDVGARNAEALTTLIHASRMRLGPVDLGGESQRTVELQARDGTLLVRVGNAPQRVL